MNWPKDLKEGRRCVEKMKSQLEFCLNGDLLQVRERLGFTIEEAEEIERQVSFFN